MRTDPPIAAIFGCSSGTLTKEEIAFFRRSNPLGLILFERNCINPQQVRKLTSHFREVVGRSDAPVLIDQEGGRVTRLKPPHWRHPPPADEFVKLADAKNDDFAANAAEASYNLIAKELSLLGININCTPVLDMPLHGADPVIGDRALGDNIARVEILAKAICSGLLKGNVLPVIKHIPGHGRALFDSHKVLPVVDASLEELEQRDFQPFVRLNKMPIAMTAHVIFTAIDERNPVTISNKVIKDVIRSYMEFEGLILSDDLSMGALSGSLEQRSKSALDAGCDLVLHCSGKFDEMESMMSGLRKMTDAACQRWENAICHLS